VKKYIKYIVTFVIILLIVVISFIIYKNLFAGSESSRYKDIENYKLTNSEINCVKDKINEIEGIKSIDVYTNKKNIIKTMVKLEQDIDFENFKKVSNETITCYSEENLSYYDLEIFLKSVNEETKNKKGYKFKTNSEFSW